MRLLVDQLGVFSESDFHSPASQLAAAGPLAFPALLDGMQSKTLAERVGSYKVVLTILGKGAAHRPPYDPWATSSRRAQQLAVWRRLLASH
jgi:hypothetical protein